jgi:hypothetical protein
MSKVQKKRLPLKIESNIVHKLEQAIVSSHVTGREYGISTNTVRKIRKNKELFNEAALR